MNVDIFAQQVNAINGRLAEMFQEVDLEQKELNLLPIAFKELGTVSEELQVALEELQQQNNELIATQAALAVERQRYQDLFDSAPDGYLVIDPNGIIREVNRAAAAMLNVQQKLLLDKPLLPFVAQEQRQSFYRELAQVQQANRVLDWEIRLQPRNGEPFDAGMKVSCVRDGEGNPVILRLCIRDITERKRMQAALLSNDYEPSQDRPVVNYAKGEVIPLKPQMIWVVCQGMVKLTTLSDNAEEVLVGLAAPSMPFGSALTCLQTYQAIALSDVKLVYFSLTEIASSQPLAKAFLPQINSRLRQTELLLAISGQRRVPDRLHHLLRFLKQEFGEPGAQGTRLNIRLTHQELADACCTTRVTITRILGKLQQKGKITIDSKNHIIILDESL